MAKKHSTSNNPRRSSRPKSAKSQAKNPATNRSSTQTQARKNPSPPSWFSGIVNAFKPTAVHQPSVPALAFQPNQPTNKPHLSQPQSNAATNKTAPSTVAPSVAKMKRDLHELLEEQTIAPARYVKQSALICQSVMDASSTIRDPNFSAASTSDLRMMSEMYDAIFFGGLCVALAKNYGMTFRWSSRMTRAGGKTTRYTQRFQRNPVVSQRFEITLSSSLLFQTFQDENREVRVCGCLCENRIQAMQRIVEHELVHLSEMLVWIDSDCSASRFQSIAGRFFGHTEHRHDLVTQRERAIQLYDIRVGSRVSFMHEGQKCLGIVNRITRRATILVESKTGVLYNDGKKYVKYYVPISALTRL